MSLISFTPSAIANAGPFPIPSLGAKTIISGTRGATVVRIPQATSLSAAIQENSDFAAKGRGSIVGVALVPKEDSSEPLLAAKVSNNVLCPTGDCPEKGPLVFVRGDIDAKTWTARIAPGIYSLYLIGGKGSLNVSLHLRGLSGTTRIKTDTEAPMKLATFEPDLQTPGNNVFSAYGDTFDLGAEGQIFSMLWIRTSVHARAETHFCLYPKHDPETSPHTIGCPFAHSQFNIGHGVISVEKAWNIVDWTVWGATGPVALGWAYESASIVENAGAVALWLPYI